MIHVTRIIAVGALLLWSMTVAAQELVYFLSFGDNGPGRSSTVLSGYLSRPTDEGQHPAVIFLHGCGGLLMGSMIAPGEGDWAGELTRRGYAVLMVDSFTPRDRREMCSPRTFDLELYRNRARDAYGALLFLQAQPFVRPDRIGIMGWPGRPNCHEATFGRRQPSIRHRATSNGSSHRGRPPSRLWY
jgi:hypothetical protein